MNAVETTPKRTPAARAHWTARLALALWAAVAVSFLAVFVLDLRLSYDLLATPCAGTDCHYQAVTPVEAAALAGWGVSVPAYARYMLGISIVPVALFSVLAVVILLRLYPQPGGFLHSLMLLVIPVVAITSFDVVAAAWPALAVPIQLLVVLGHLLLMSFFLVFPRARFEPRWTVILPFVAAFVGVGTAFFPVNLPVLLRVPTYSLLLVLIAAVLIHRYRRLFDDNERRRVKWIVLGSLIFFGGVPIWTYIFEVAGPAAGRDSLLLMLGGWTLLMLMTLVLPATIFIAIFRHQLWDIDLILNRTLVYGGLTAGIIAAYALIVGGLGALLHARSSFLLSLVATGLIALLFQPVRERLQRSANRLLFGQRDDPYAVLSGLGRRLQETAVPDQTLPAIAATITHTLRLPYAAVEVETAGGERRIVAAHGQRPPQLAEWPLRYQGQVIGRLVVAPRSPGDAFTTRERQLLGDIAAQAGAAAYAARLTAALQRSRERLVLAREEERRRIRRDLHDGLGPTLASQTFALDAILDLLETDPPEASRRLLRLKAQNQATVAEIRRLVYALRPPALDELGLVGALQAHAAQLDGLGALAVHIAARPAPLPPLSAAVEAAAYRIALEAITNAARHARAGRCDVGIRVRPEGRPYLQLDISDDGDGLPPGAPVGVGILSMRERAEELGGTLTITSGPRGARVTAVLPLTEEPDTPEP